MKWMDLNRDGNVDAAEEYFGMEMLCGSREEYEALFGDGGTLTKMKQRISMMN